jgi:hypothetical protein
MSTNSEQNLQNKIYLITGGKLEEYLPDLRNFHTLGDLVLRAHSTLEGGLEELILAHLKGWKNNINLAMLTAAYFDYGPLLEKMYFLEKFTACQKYALISKDKKNRLRGLLLKINDMRNKFAHYQSYAGELQSSYDTPVKREKLLKELIEALGLIEVKINQTYTKSLA